MIPEYADRNHARPFNALTRASGEALAAELRAAYQRVGHPNPTAHAEATVKARALARQLRALNEARSRQGLPAIPIPAAPAPSRADRERRLSAAERGIEADRRAGRMAPARPRGEGQRWAEVIG
jgi:hypothetical protein